MPRDNNKKVYLTTGPKPAVVGPTPAVIGPTFGQAIKDGFGLGIGSSIGRHLIDSFFNRIEGPHEKCNVERIEFENCIRTNSSCEGKQYSFQQCLQAK